MTWAYSQVKAVLLASPGFVNTDFFAFMNNEVRLVHSIPSHSKFGASRLVHLPLTLTPIMTPRILHQAQLKDDRALLQNKAKFVLCHSSSGHKHALEEVLTQPVSLIVDLHR